jgi:glycosyltransferase involved in cell wall biosynthesis
MFSVIIPTCNRNDLLRKCLKAFENSNQAIFDGMYEVTVTDDSKDGIAKELIKKEFSWANWVEGPHRGPAANRNKGAKNSLGEWLVFIDDDCLPSSDLLKNYQNAIAKNPGKLAFEGSIVPDDWSLMKKEMAECPINTNGDCFWSANICINSMLFAAINGFDETFPLAAMEDLDIYERLKKFTEIPFLKECVVVHPVRFGSFSKKVKGMKMQFVNWIYYTKKHSKIKISSHLLKSVADYIKMSGKDILKFRYKLFTLHMLSSFYCFYLFIKYRKE